MTKQTIENHICEALSGETQKLALNFIAHLQRQGMLFERAAGYWADKRYWSIKYKNDFVCFILLNGYGSARHKDEAEGWVIWSDDSGEAWFADARPNKSTQKTALENIDYCCHCGYCNGGTHKTIFGKEYAGVCRTVFRFDNPDAKALECAGQLAKLRKDFIDARE